MEFPTEVRFEERFFFFPVARQLINKDVRSLSSTQRQSFWQCRMNVEFSVQEVNLVNLFPEKETAGVKNKHTFYVSNRFGSSKKVRIALSKNSHTVSAPP